MKYPSSIVAAALLVAAACGGGGSGQDPEVDASIDATVDIPDAGPDSRGQTPACLAPPAGVTAAPCRECLVNPALSVGDSLCTEAVCAIDPSCCQTGWTERCTELADRACPDLDCINAISMGGNGAISYARYDEGFDGTVWASTLDFNMLSVAWADYDSDGDADLAIAGTCKARVLRNDGGSGTTLTLVPMFEYKPFPDECVSPNPAFMGQRVRWADIDHDGDLDLAFGGGGGGHGLAFWVRYTGGDFSLAADLVPDGAREVSDLVMFDVDDDLLLDAIITFGNAPARLFRNTALDGFVEDATWQGGLSSALTIELCDLVGDVRPEIVMVGYASNAAYRLTGGGVGTTLYPLGFPVSSAYDLACGDLDGDPDGKEEAAFLISEGLVKIVDGEDGVVWDSELDATPPYSEISFGIDAGDLDHDGDLDLVVSVGETLNAPFYMMWNTGGAGPLDFTPESIVDLTPDAHTARAEMTWLASP